MFYKSYCTAMNKRRLTYAIVVVNSPINDFSIEVDIFPIQQIYFPVSTVIGNRKPQLVELHTEDQSWRVWVTGTQARRRTPFESDGWRSREKPSAAKSKNSRIKPLLPKANPVFSNSAPAPPRYGVIIPSIPVNFCALYHCIYCLRHFFKKFDSQKIQGQIVLSLMMMSRIKLEVF